MFSSVRSPQDRLTWEELALIYPNDAVGVRSILSVTELVCRVGSQLRAVVCCDDCLTAVSIVALHEDYLQCWASKG